MKNNRNNQEKLNDALGMVDEELVQGVMLHVEGMRAAHLSRRAVIRRRVAVLAAACLSLCMVAGAMLAVPLLTAEDPSCLAELPPEAAIRVRVIPAQGIGGRTVFLALRPDRLAVDGMEKEALLALGNEGFDGADALVPGCLSEG